MRVVMCKLFVCVRTVRATRSYRKGQPSLTVVAGEGAGPTAAAHVLVPAIFPLGQILTLLLPDGARNAKGGWLLP
jgi:hypothetical protein